MGSGSTTEHAKSGISAHPMGDDSGMLESLDRAGRSPLHYAALEGDVNTADELIAKGLEPGLPDGAGFTPLHLAAQGQRAVVARHLLAVGAPVDLQDRFGRTALWVALVNARGRRLHKLLNVEHVSYPDETPTVVINIWGVGSPRPRGCRPVSRP